MIKMFIGNEEVVSNHEFTIKEEMLSASSTILNNCYPKSWELTKDYVSNFYYPKDYSKFVLASGEFEHGNTEYSILDVSGNQPQFETNVEKEWNSLNIYGKTEQATAPEEWGKNLLYLGNNPTVSGLTITKESNSSIKINGTASSNVTLNYNLLYGKTLDNQLYSLSIISSEKLNDRLFFTFANLGDLSAIEFPANLTSISRTSTSLSGKKPTQLAINIRANTVFDNTVIQLQLQQGNVSAFEPATYTPPMPSPDKPSELNSVGYENLAYTEWAEDFVARINNNEKAKIEIYDNKNCLAYMPNAGYNDYDNKYLFKINWKANTQYTFIFDKYSTGTWGDLDITYTDGTKQELTGLTANAWNHIKMTSQANKTIKYLNAHWRNNALQYIDLDSFGVYEGADTHSYIPYGKYGIEVKTTGKNLFNKNLFNDFTSSLQYLNLQLEPNTTYTMSSSLPPYTTNPLFANLFVMNSTDSPNSTTNSVYPNAPRNVTTLNDGIVKIAYGDGNNDYSDEKNTYWYQLEKGTQSTKYEPYKENTQLYQLDEPLRANGDTKDLLYIKNGILYVERKIKSIILNGSEKWRYYSSAAPYGVTLTDNKDFNSDSADFKTNYFENKIWNQTTFIDYNSLVSSVTDKPKELRFRYADITSLADFKTWLSTHNTEVQYILAEPYTEELGKVQIPYSFEGVNNVFLDTGIVNTIIDVYYYWKNYDVIFAGIVKNSGDISLNPRHPHYCSLQILDYKTFLSESDTLDYVISNKTIREAIEMVVDTVSDYGFSVGTIDISNADDVIGAYSTLNKTAYDVLQYLADISGSRWRARYIDNSSMAIDFYDPDTLPQVEDIEYTQEYWENNNIVDLTFNYGTRDYRNKQIMLSDEVYAGIDYTELILSNGYETNFITQNNIAIIKNININGIEKDFTTQEEKELGVDADFYYTPGKNIIESATSYTAGTQIVVTYTPLVKGRQLTYNNEEVLRIATQTNTLGIIARYENRNDILSTKELEEIGKTYIEYKGKPEVILTLTTHNKDLFNIGEVVYFNSPIDELKQKYMVKSKETQYIIESDTGVINLFYVYELTSSFNSEKAINYFDNQRNKAQGNIQEGESITRNIDINKIATIIWDNPTITETTITVVGDNILNGILNSPFIE